MVASEDALSLAFRLDVSSVLVVFAAIWDDADDREADFVDAVVSLLVAVTARYRTNENCTGSVSFC